MEHSPRPERITMKTIGYGLLELFNLERGLVHTLIALTIQPGKALRTYLAEDRTRLVPPFRFLLFAVAAAAFITVQYMKSSEFMAEMRAGFESGYRAGSENGELDTEKMETFLLFLNEIFANYFNIALLVGVPIVALCTFWILRKGHNYAEHLVINCYVTGYQNIMYIIMTPLLFFMKFTTLSYIYIVLILIYGIYAYVRVFQERFVIGTFKALLANLLYFVLYYILLIAVIFIAGIYILK